jgi:hypothetical protein
MAASKAQQWCFLAPFWLAPMVQNPNLVFFVCNESRFHHPKTSTMTHHSSALYNLHAHFRHVATDQHPIQHF